MSKPALHIVSLPHTSTKREFSWCAYTMKCLKAADMFTKDGYEVYLYASTESDSICKETVACVDAPKDASVTQPQWTLEYFSNMNNRVIEQMQDRIQPRDLILLITGWPQKPIADAFPNNMAVEYGIGYEGTFSNYRVFESYAWAQAVYGWEAGNANSSVMSKQGRFYDTVIPNYFEVNQFPAGDGLGDYILFIGRLTELKGVQIAVDVSKRTGIPLKIAGQGIPPDHGEYMGVVGPEERAKLMGEARAVFVPTLYLEPFGGVNVEAQLCGTPVITTDWGAFPETVEDGVTGFRCRTQGEFDQAAIDALTLDRSYIRARAIAKYGTEAVVKQYTRYFNRLAGLWGEGFYEPRLSER